MEGKIHNSTEKHETTHGSYTKHFAVQQHDKQHTALRWSWAGKIHSTNHVYFLVNYSRSALLSHFDSLEKKKPSSLLNAHSTNPHNRNSSVWAKLRKKTQLREIINCMSGIFFVRRFDWASVRQAICNRYAVLHCHVYMRPKYLKLYEFEVKNVGSSSWQQSEEKNNEFE